MSSATWTTDDTEQALNLWEDYQRTHDISNRKGEAVGIDPASGRIWFGKSSLDIKLQQDAAGDAAPLYFLRVGHDFYGRKSGMVRMNLMVGM